MRFTTSDRDEAEEIIGGLYLPNRIDLSRGSMPFNMEVTALRLGALTAGRLTYGRHLRLKTADAENFHVNIPVRGRVASRSGSGGLVATSPGEGLIFSPGEPAEMSWTAGSEQLCLMVPRVRLEAELERLLGRSLKSRLGFEFVSDLTSPMGRRWATALELVAGELDQPTLMSQSPHVAQHLEGLIFDGLLLGQRHNHSAEVSFPGPAGSNGAIKRAVELIHERPAEPWTTTRLAAEVHLSVRALQAGFRRDLSTTPMTYLRKARLRQAHADLSAAHRHQTTVRTVATRVGILHMSRFAAAYRAEFGEMPSETLDRPADVDMQIPGRVAQRFGCQSEPSS